jgi:hypothetical protein
MAQVVAAQNCALGKGGGSGSTAVPTPLCLELLAGAAFVSRPGGRQLWVAGIDYQRGDHAQKLFHYTAVQWRMAPNWRYEV